jgi:hypothetical protein
MAGSALLHFDVGDSGRLGFDYGDEKGALVREELTPGDSCPILR